MVFGLEDEYSEADLPSWGDVPVRSHSVVGPRSFGFSPKLARAIRDARCDLLHEHVLWLYPSIASLRAFRRGKVPRVMTPHGALDPWALQNSAWKKKIAQWLYENAHLRAAACLHALSESEVASMRSLGLRNPICLIPYGQELPPDTAEGRLSEARRALPGRHALLFLSRLHPKKGLANLLRAWANCRKAEPEAAHWNLVVAGGDEGGHGSVLKRTVSELGIEDSVVFTGPLFDSRKVQAFESAKALVLPSYSEGMPVAVLEAWAWRLPVVMTPQCNLPEGFAAGAALRVEPNVESLSHGLRELFWMSESEREQMGARGRRLLEQRFSWPRVAEQMVGVYRWLLGGGPRPDCVQEA